MLIDGVR